MGHQSFEKSENHQICLQSDLNKHTKWVSKVGGGSGGVWRMFLKKISKKCQMTTFGQDVGPAAQIHGFWPSG